MELSNITNEKYDSTMEFREEISKLIKESFPNVSNVETKVSDIVKESKFWEITVSYTFKKSNHIYSSHEKRYFYVGRNGGFYIVSRNNIYSKIYRPIDVLTRGKRQCNEETKEQSCKKRRVKP